MIKQSKRDNFFIIKLLLIVLLFLAPVKAFSMDLDKYFDECENCVKTQKSISGAIDLYCMDFNIASFSIRTEDDYQSFLKEAYIRKYIKDPDIIYNKVCSLRYSSENGDLHCVKHGCTEYVGGYKYSKKNNDMQKNIFWVFCIIGVGSVLYAIFLK